MSDRDIIRAWKDRRLRASHDSDALPEHPAGAVQVADERLASVGGGAQVMISIVCWPTAGDPCTAYTGCYPSHCGPPDRLE